MGGDTLGAQGFALLFFPARAGNTYIMYVSSPPPAWLDGRDKTCIKLERAGMFLLSYIARSGEHGRACITVNGREVEGSEARARHGEVCGSAVCTVRSPALPCTLGIKTSGEVRGGVLLVAEI